MMMVHHHVNQSPEFKTCQRLDRHIVIHSCNTGGAWARWLRHHLPRAGLGRTSWGVSCSSVPSATWPRTVPPRTDQGQPAHDISTHSNALLSVKYTIHTTATPALLGIRCAVQSQQRGCLRPRQSSQGLRCTANGVRSSRPCYRCNLPTSSVSVIPLCAVLLDRFVFLCNFV